jgi:hypothetical protein
MAFDSLPSCCSIPNHQHGANLTSRRIPLIFVIDANLQMIWRGCTKGTTSSKRYSCFSSLLLTLEYPLQSLVNRCLVSSIKLKMLEVLEDWQV